MVKLKIFPNEKTRTEVVYFIRPRERVLKCATFESLNNVFMSLISPPGYNDIIPSPTENPRAEAAWLSGKRD